MPRGQSTKEKITKIILECFPNSFINGKEIRIAAQEDGEEVQIKVTLTAAKENVDHESNITPSAEKPNMISSITEPTEEEIERVKELANKLGIF